MSSRFANLQKTLRRQPWSQRPQPLPGLRQRTLQKLIASFLLLTMTSMVTLSAQAAAAQALQKPVSVAPAVKTANLSDALKDLHESLHKTQRNASAQDKAQAGASGIITSIKNLVSGTGPSALRHQGAQDLLTREASITKLEADTLKTFAATEAHLKAAHLPATILQRHFAAVQQFQQRSQVLHSKFASLRDADSKGDSTTVQNTLGDIDSTLSQWEPKARQVDPKHLPWGSPSNKVRAPYKDKNDYLQHLSLFGIKPIQVAYNGNGRPVPAGTVWPTLPQMTDTVVPADTQPTEDVQITPAIQALASQLNNNPVLIYQWVYNNIRYVPTYGSIQGADMTRQTLQGNDLDTASLLISLLRAANVPARYVYGTINVPVAQVENWVGGVNNADAALNLLGQGGVPSIGLAIGGKITRIQMEHVWVEAYVNFVPSRGWSSKNPDAWVPMDGSFKQYTYTAPINLQMLVPVDTNGIINSVQNGATTDPQGNYVQNLNQTAMQAAIANYPQQVQNYISQQQPNATTTNLFGSQTILPYKAKVLSSVLPYSLTAVGGDFDSLPATMRHSFEYQVFMSSDDLASGAPAIDYKASLPQLAGHLLALSFRPATADDEATLESYLPERDSSGAAVGPTSFPQQLPGYAINLVPELTLDGNVVASATGAVSMGNIIIARTTLNDPGIAGGSGDQNVAAGEYHAIGLDMGAISSSSLQRIQNSLGQAMAMLQSGQLANKHDLIGAYLQAGIYGYFATNDLLDQLSALSVGANVNRLPSFGTFSTTLSVNLAYGVPMQVSTNSTTMDVGHLYWQAADNNNSDQRRVAFNWMSSIRSSENEFLIPGYLASTAATPAQGVSAVNAIQIAGSQGQKIFSINQGNIDTVLPQLNLSQDVMNDISNGALSGSEIIVSQSNVSSGNWTGVGYIIVDPKTGTGAYKIGGVNGGNVTLGGAAAALFGIDAVVTPALNSFSRLVGLDSAMFSDLLEQRISELDATEKVGYLGLFAESALTIIKNHGVIDAKVIGQISLNLMNFALVDILAGAAVAGIGALIGGGTLGPLAIMLITVSISVIVTKLFEWLAEVLFEASIRGYRKKSQAGLRFEAQIG